MTINEKEEIRRQYKNTPILFWGFLSVELLFRFLFKTGGV